MLAKNFQLSPAQTKLLNKGLTFVPSLGIHKAPKEKFLQDLKKYHRIIKLEAFFKHDRDTKPQPFTAPSTWEPPPQTLPPEIEILIKKDHGEVDKYYKKFHEVINISKPEIRALKELKNNHQIVIKKADKGSAVVIMDRDQYIMEAERQLGDPVYYKKLKEPIFPKTIKAVQRIIEDLYMKKFITKRQLDFLTIKDNPRIRRFYTLPKIHKEPHKWTVPHQVPPGRPIVSDCSSDTCATAELITHYLHPLSTKHPAYLKDTNHFINIIKNLIIPPNSLLFTIDIDSLYTNIDTFAGLKAVRDAFNSHPDDSRPDGSILSLLQINLTKNDFEFNNQYYLQIKGTAMGKKFAPSYANIFMADWERRALATCKKTPFTYLRYLDDIFGIWTHSEEDFQQFIQTLDTFDPSIRLKYTQSYDTVDFLDTTVYKGANFTQTHILNLKVFFKETDTHALLFKTSFHPRHTFKGLIKSQLLRFSRICTTEQDFMEATKILFTALRKRGYSRSFLRGCLKTFLDKKESATGKTLPLITQYSTISRLLHSKIKANFQTYITEQGLMPQYKVVSAFQKHRSLSDLLVRARLKTLT